MILAEKFYLFDVGVTNHLARRSVRLGSWEFGKAFEHYILMELKAYQAYRSPDLPIAYWRSAAGQEVDFILGDKDAAIEVKGSARVHDGDLKGLHALHEDGRVRRSIVVAMESQPRRLSKEIEVLPWRMFLDQLWAGRVV